MMRVSIPLLALLAFGFMDRAAAARIKSITGMASDPDNEALVQLTEHADSTFRNSPLVYNNCKMPLAVYLERGFLFNRQVIQPGEAVQLHSPSNGPNFLPYSIIAIVGDESALPTDWDSLLHFIGKAAVPTAFVAGVVASFLNQGAFALVLNQGSFFAQLEPLYRYALDIIQAGTAGVAAAETAIKAAEMIVKQHPAAFMAKRKWVFPGTQYFEVVGGPDEDSGEDPPPLEIKPMTLEQYFSHQVNVETVKVCQALHTRGHVGTRAFTIEGCGDTRVNGNWRVGPYHRDRPTYLPYADVDLMIYWSKARNMWRLTTMTHPGVTPLARLWPRTTFFESNADSATMPDHGWKKIGGIGKPPSVKLSVAFTIRNCGDARLNGLWTHDGEHNGRPQYMPINGDEDDEVVIQYSGKRGIWRATTAGGWRRTTLFSSKTNTTDVPLSNWKVKGGVGPAPHFALIW